MTEAVKEKFNGLSESLKEKVLDSFEALDEVDFSQLDDDLLASLKTTAHMTAQQGALLLFIPSVLLLLVCHLVGVICVICITTNYLLQRTQS